MGNTIFGNRVRSLRKDKGLSMQALAEELEINKSRIGMWESNGVVPRKEALVSVANYFNVTTDYLLGNDEKNTIIPQNKKLYYLQRSLEKMDADQLRTAESMLKAVFKNIFEDEEGDDDGI